MSDLYKLIIVDDEFIILDGLMSYNWHDFGFHPIGSASNGRKALELMKVDPADVIITDIKMPIMDGIELIKIINEKYPNCKLVVLSGYKEFEYARAAMQSGIFDYLLKPVDFVELEDILCKLKQKLDSEKSISKLMDLYGKQLVETLPLAVDNFLKEIIEGKLNDLLEIKEKMDLLEINLGRSYYSCVVLQLDFSGSFTSSAMSDMYLRTGEYLETNGLGYALINDNTELVTILNFNLVEKESNTYSYLVSVVNDVASIIREITIKYDSFSFSIGVGSIYNSILMSSQSYQQAKQSLKRTFFDTEKEIFLSWKEKSTYINEITSYPYDKENQLISAILDGNLEVSLYSLQEFWSEINICFKQTSPENIQNLIVQFLNMLEHKLNRHNTSLNAIFDISPPFTTFVYSMRTLEDLKTKIQELIELTVATVYKMNESVKTSSHSAIKKAVKYIYEHYDEKITLTSIAEMVYLNPSYFSVQFKKEIGKNFIDFLKECRIEKAKELLKSGDLKVYEIGELVGFQNPKYFTNMFKEFTNLSPLEYRQKLITD